MQQPEEFATVAAQTGGCFVGQRSPILDDMNRHKISAVGKLALGIGGVAVEVVAALFDAFKQVFAAGETESDDGRQLHDSDLSGQLNHRTGRLDSGTDPYGWYDRD